MENNTELYGANDFRNYELYHHGILGQKWGVRRYQNSDGTLTDEGRKRYGLTDEKIEKMAARAERIQSKVNEDRNNALHKRFDKLNRMDDSEKAKEVFKNVENAKTLREKIPALYRDCKHSNYYDDNESKEDRKKRMNETAELGLKAMEKLSPGKDYEPTKANKEWFYYEDQTIGYAMIAGLVREGYSAKDCSKLIDTAESLDKRKKSGEDKSIDTYDYEDFGRAVSGAAFEIKNGYRLKEFAKACEEAKKDSIKTVDDAMAEFDKSAKKLDLTKAQEAQLKKARNEAERQLKKKMESYTLNDYSQSAEYQSQMNQQQFQQFMDYTTQMSVQAANRAASLAMTQGMNPFLFG